MGTQSLLKTSQPSESTNPETYQYWAETAIIGEDTRRLLVVWGKLNDVANEYSELIEKLYKSQVDQMLESFMANISEASNEVVRLQSNVYHYKFTVLGFYKQVF